jgi:hypothetical protein
MTTNTDGQTIDPTVAADAQAKLAKSIGEPLTVESHDADVPLWRRWLKRITHA